MTDTFVSNFNRDLPQALKTALGKLPPSQQGAMLDPQGLINASSQQAIQSQFAAFGQQGQVLYQQFIDTVRGALSTGMTHLFALGLVFMILAVLAALILPEVRLQLDEFFEK
jgi:hypothetical protein